MAGEVGLSGEVRPVNRIEQRIAEAEKLGFNHIILPQYNMQGFNAYFLKCSIVLILLAVLLFVTNTHVRRRYYIGNYISIAAFAAANFYIAFDAHTYIELFKARFLAIDFEALRAHADLWKSAYTESTFWFDVHYAVFAVSLLVSVGLVLCAVWKIWLMREEAALIKQGKEAAA